MATSPTSQTRDIALFLCSYGRDALRARRLVDSAERNNRDGLPLLIAVPRRHRQCFWDCVGRERATWLDQEDVYALSPSANSCCFDLVSGGDMQQVVKAEAWRLRVAETLMVLDSDCVFLRPFGVTDFVDAQGTPITILEPAEGVRRLAMSLRRPTVWQDWLRTSTKARRLVGRTDPMAYSFGGAPFVWNAKVWSALEAKVLAPAGKTLLDAVREVGSELMIYGEAALALGAIPIRPSARLFKLYLYQEEFWCDQAQGVKASELATNYMGVVYQSNWQQDLDHPDYRRPFMSRLGRRLRSTAARTAWTLSRKRLDPPYAQTDEWRPQ